MGGHEKFERILGALHEAVLDDDLWPAASGLIDEVCASKGNSLVSGKGASVDDVELLFAQFCYRGQRREDLERLYFSTYHAVDERVPRVPQLPDSQVTHVSSLFTDEEKKTSLVYNEVLAPTDTRDSLHVRLDGPRASSIVWVVADPVNSNGWSSARVDVIERLLPHLRQYMRVRQALVDSRARGRSIAALLENTRCGIVQLDRRGQVVAANDVARALLRKGDGLTVRHGLLCATVAEDDDALQKLLARALPPFGAQGESGSTTVRRKAMSPRLVLHASPVVGAQANARPSRIAALLLVIDPASRLRIDPGLVGAMLGLTPAESHVAALLAQGCTIRDIAFATDRSEGTIRWHTKQIYRKQGISGQRELVRLVQALSDIAQQRP